MATTSNVKMSSNGEERESEGMNKERLRSGAAELRRGIKTLGLFALTERKKGVLEMSGDDVPYGMHNLVNLSSTQKCQISE